MNRNSLVLCAVFFLSGAAALLFETLWFRFAGLAFGNSVWASALTLSAFMAGLALGNGLAARYGHRILRPVRTYAIVEVVVAVSGVAIVLLLPMLTTVLAPMFQPLLESPALLNPLRLVLSFVILTIPATAMGLTLPLLVKALHRDSSHFGATLGVLYGWNTLGAVAGALVGELFVIELLGVVGAALCAAAFNGLAAVGALAIAKDTDAPEGAPVSAEPKTQTPERAPRLLAAAFLSGGVLLGLEVVWFRFLQLFFPGTSLTFAIMLAIVLCGIALGGLVAWGLYRVTPRPSDHTSTLALVSGIVALGAYLSFQWVLEDREHAAVSGYGLTSIVLSLWLMFPVCLLSGILFSLVGHLAHEKIRDEARATGLVTMANTIGAALGPLLAGFFLIPKLGMELSLGLFGVAYGVVAWAVAKPDSWRVSRPQQGAAALLGVTVITFCALGRMDDYIATASSQYTRPDTKVVAVREGLTETIQYLETSYLDRPLFYRLMTNSFSMAGTTWGAKRYMKAYVYLPIAMHADPQDALLISYGTASTAKALTDASGLKHIDIVDISREILDMGDILFKEPGESPLADPRVQVHVEDGRFFLQVTDRRYDIITSEPPPPKHAGVVNLYTQEYFQLCHDRLKEGGFVTYWLPVYETDVQETKSIVKAFLNVFDDTTLWTGRGFDWMLVGTRGHQTAVSAQQFARQWTDVNQLRELVTLGFERPEMLLSTYLMGPEELRDWTADAEPLTDFDPKQLGWQLGAGRPHLDEYAKLMDVKRTQPLFEASSEIKKLAPPEFIESTKRYFWLQEILNTLGHPDPGKGKIGLGGQWHRLLTQSTVRSPVLWENRIGEPVLEIVAAHERDGGELTSRELIYKSAGFLAARKYAKAERALAQAGGQDVTLMRLYYASLGEDFALASQIAEENRAWFQENPERLRFMTWLSKATKFQLPAWVK